VKKIIVLAFVAMMVFGPVVNVLAVDGDPSAVDTIQLGDPKVSETTSVPDFFSSIAKFFDTLIPMVPWALLASVIFIAMWVYFDASRRTNYGWLWGIASLLVVPWLIYLACRPPYTIEEMKLIEADANLRRIEKEYYQYVLTKEKYICGVCGTPVQPDYQVCPSCYKELKKVCPSCGKLLDPEWHICPYCASRITDRPKGA